MQGDSVSTAAASGGTLLLSIKAAQLHRVSGGQQQLVAQGPLTITAVDKPAPQPQKTKPPAAAPPTSPPTGPPPGQLYPEVYKGAAEQYDSDSSQDGGVSASGSTSIVAAVGDYSWEVMPASQTLKAGELTFVLSTQQQDTFLSVTLAANTDAEEVGILEAVLENFTVYKESKALLEDPEAQAGEVVLAQHAYKSSLARGVQGVSRKLATGLLATATYATNAITKSASTLTPAQPTATPMNISAGMKKRIRQTERATSYAAKAVNVAVSGLAWMGAKVAGGVLWLAGADKPLKPGEEPSTLREVGHAAVVGFTETWDAMEQAGKTVLMSARDNTASVVRQRYGEDAADASVHSMNAAGHSAEAVYAVRKIGVKTVAKSAAKRTAQGVIYKWAGKDNVPGGSSSKPSSGRNSPSSLPAAPAAKTGA